ncbi:hypothetical protein L873DRAFT_1847380 [Choiromyces venosus 120613-1]|uniref:Uncharacterized protein n=1 Tax=Choiromyces venosus 120613-1 TaxID=1336337 RepID=A0A3N4J4R3_9PEZI|nr:hypothetical protein L873DRAFT_1847380 [Choiromyces venosus 120613-1]
MRCNLQTSHSTISQAPPANYKRTHHTTLPQSNWSNNYPSSYVGQCGSQGLQKLTDCKPEGQGANELSAAEMKAKVAQAKASHLPVCGTRVLGIEITESELGTTAMLEGTPGPVRGKSGSSGLRDS